MSRWKAPALERATEGLDEFYIRIKTILSIEVWIYINEAGISGPNIDIMLESYDYSTGDDLIVDLISYLDRLLDPKVSLVEKEIKTHQIRLFNWGKI